MTQLKKILVPTDLSENSRRGLSYALSVVAESKAELMILHVADEFQARELYSDEMAFVSSSGPTWPVDRVVQEATLDLNRFLEEHKEDIRRVPTVRRKVVLGDVVEKIVDMAREEEVDLIVMSPRPHGALKRFFLGSVTDRVTRQAPCPVLSICQPQPSRPWRGKLIPSALLPLRHEEANT
jgi:nucleotide-binding universal stress UspA family protein